MFKCWEIHQSQQLSSLASALGRQRLFERDSRTDFYCRPLVNNLRVQGVFADPTEDKLFVVSYPKKEVEPLSGFAKKDLESAIELKLLRETTEILKINGKECPVYMKTVNVTNNEG